MAGADPTNHVAVAVQPFTDNWDNDGPYQLATYTADTSGNLTTSSTYANMPKVAVGNISDYRISPNGKFLAVCGTSGLQAFRFRGAGPITKYSGRLITKAVDAVYWDNDHLYAISRMDGKLYVFTVNSTGVTQAPGSPHSIITPVSIIVLPRT